MAGHIIPLQPGCDYNEGDGQQSNRLITVVPVLGQVFEFPGSALPKSAVPRQNSNLSFGRASSDEAGSDKYQAADQCH